MWLNSALGRKPQQRTEDKGNAVPCRHCLMGAEPQRAADKGRVKKQECPITQRGLGAREEAGQDQLSCIQHTG